MSRALVEAVAARVESAAGVNGNRIVYRNAVPDNPAAQYVVVRANVGENESFDLADSQSLRNATVWVTSVSRGSDQQTVVNPDQQAAEEAMWGMEKAHAALTNWRPTIGTAGAWKAQVLSSQPVTRDESLPSTVMFAVETYGFTYQV